MLCILRAGWKTFHSTKPACLSVGPPRPDIIPLTVYIEIYIDVILQLGTKTISRLQQKSVS